MAAPAYAAEHIEPVGVSLAVPLSKRYPNVESVVEQLERRHVRFRGQVRQEELESGPHWVVDLVEREGRRWVKGLASPTHAFDRFKLLVLWEQRT